MKTIFVLLSITCLVSFASCNSIESEPNQDKKIELDSKSAQLVEANNEFGLELFRKITESSTQENLMISPLSVSLALGMAYNGANGDTKTEMEELLRVNGLTTEQINASYQMLIQALQSLDEDVTFEIANAIYYMNGFSVKQNFLDLNKTYYDAEVDDLDFSSPSALETINGWVAEKTHDKITKILDQLSPYDRMVLLNAIYFYGNWTTHFDENGTQMKEFYLSDGSAKEVETMSKEDKLPYSTNDLFSAVQIPYGTGQYNMTILLPQSGKTSGDVIESLNNENWKNWSKDFEETEHVVVNLPRFKFGFETGLNNILKEMGMVKAFSDTEANFSNISDQFLYISSVIHKTYIDVNETGTEAAAVTAVVFTTNSIGNEPPKTYFTVNRPFVFAITEKDTGAILFIGEVQNPVYED
ncbi:MAG TPA: serpin family protein [Draconibacterium sp.]|nr:serpin family protein [Draconibacterium sp.]